MDVTIHISWMYCTLAFSGIKLTAVPKAMQKRVRGVCDDTLVCLCVIGMKCVYDTCVHMLIIWRGMLALDLKVIQ